MNAARFNKAHQVMSIVFLNNYKHVILTDDSALQNDARTLQIPLRVGGMRNFCKTAYQ
jgi:hypothetical protein